jgi:hypothetical protein
MSPWTPQQEWAGADAIIIGGGPSLRGFDFRRLAGHRTIGCNSAFRLGPEICKICFFSDTSFWESNLEDLCLFPGRVVTSQEDVTTPWILKMRREEQGLHKDALGFGGNSGCGAINLALILGATRVFLLGFDCKAEADGRSNWHDFQGQSSPEVYPRFLEGFAAVARDLPHVFPGSIIINLTPGTMIPFFPVAHPDNYLKKAA